MSLALLKSIDAQSYDVLSVDVFDTLLLRDASVQRARFAEVASVLARTLAGQGSQLEAKTLLSLRQRVHGLSYQAVSIERPWGDATLASMSALQIRLLGLKESILSLFIDAELDVESRHLTLNRPLLRFIEALRRGGRRVIAVSDMYLSATDIERLTVKVAGSTLVDQIYSSSDLGLTKHSGEIFAKIAGLERVPNSRILHFGDNERADLTMARMAGCQAVLLRRPGWHFARRLAAARSIPKLLAEV